MEADDQQQDPGVDEPNGKGSFLVGEETEDVKPTGVDDQSTGMEGDDPFGQTNIKERANQ